jgi:hypothetical protein
MQVEINIVAVLLAAVASMVVGSIWYAKPVFGTMWSGLVKLSDSKMRKGAPLAMAGAALMSIVTAYVLAHVTYISSAFFQVSFMESALNTAFWLWVGVSLTSMVMHGLFEQRRKKLIILTAFHELVSFVTMALVIGWLKP